MQKQAPIVVVLGTGGTIAGTASARLDNVGYSAAQLSVARLVEAVPSLSGQALEVEQVAQLDSKDMDAATWLALASCLERHLQRDEVAGVVVTHGTDTLEETAYFLQRVLAPAKPVVLVAAMRPATSIQADGPQNLIDALTVAREPGARGVVAVLAGRVHSALDVRKTHPYRLDAFGSGDAGPIAEIEEGVVRRHRDWPTGEAVGLMRLPRKADGWPRVEILTSHAGASGRMVEALRQVGVQGIVVAGTGNGTVHHALASALRQAQAEGVAVLRSSRTLGGRVIGAGGADLPSAGALTPVQARIELMLRLMAARVA